MNLEGALTWAFTFEDQPPFAGFRQLASAGLDLPVLNVFRMFAKMRGNQLSVQSSAAIDADYILANNVRDKADVSGYAALDGQELTVLVWHYHDDDVAGLAAAVTLTLQGVPFAGKNLTIDALPDRRGPQQCLRRLEEARFSRLVDRLRNSSNSNRPASWPRWASPNPCRLHPAKPR